MERELAGIHSGNVEQVVDDAQQQLRAIENIAQDVAFLVARGTHAVQNEFGEAQNGVERGTQFVRNVRQELIFGGVRLGKFGDVRYETQVVEGSLWPALQQVIEENDVDLIVTGTHGRTGPSKLPVGSAAEKIFRLAVKPVLSVGSLSRPVARNQGIQRVLFTTNFSPYSDRASRYAVAIAAEFEAELIGLHAVAEGSARVGNGRSLIEDFFVQRLRKSMPPQVECLARVRFEVVLGDAVEAILSAAGSLQADIIVMGLQSVLHSAGQLPSAIAYRTVCRAPCPVLTVRC